MLYTSKTEAMADSYTINGKIVKSGTIRAANSDCLRVVRYVHWIVATITVRATGTANCQV